MIVKNQQNEIATIRKESEKRLSPSALPPPPKKKLGMEDYMNIMIRQLQYQDPFHPMDNRKFASQLAQFSQLDQLVHMNKKMEGMANQGRETDALQMVGFLGREVFLKGNRFIKGAHQEATLVFHLDRPAHNATVYVYGAKHQLVRSFKVGPMDAGDQHVAWDGLSNKGSKAPAGGYEFEVVARDAKNRPVPASPLRTGVVTGVVFSGTKPLLEVNGERVDLGQITHVGVAKPTGLPPPPQRQTLPVAPSKIPGMTPRVAPGAYAKAPGKTGPTINHTL